MLNPIRFLGLSLNSDELATENGELAVSAGVELKDGFIRPSVLTGSEIGSLTVNGVNATLIFVHNTGSYTHYLAYYTASSTKKLVYFSTSSTGQWEASTPISLSFDISKIKDIDSVGNTLVIIDTDGIVHYVLWRNGAYEELPQKPPMIDILFRLGADKVAKYPVIDNIKNPDGITDGTWAGYRAAGCSWSDAVEVVGSDMKIKDDYKSLVQNTAYALMNECNAIISKAGHFYAPFMVRYCYRMFDGSFFMHSAPVYIPAITHSLAPVTVANVNYANMISGGSYVGDRFNVYKEGVANNSYVKVSFGGIVLRYAPLNCALEYQILNQSYLSDLDKWKDVIKSVDIFITPPQTALKTDREITRVVKHLYTDYHQSSEGKTDNYQKTYQEVWNNSEEHVSGFDTRNFYNVDIPLLTGQEYFKQVRNSNAFFRLKSIDLDKISERAQQTSGTWTELDVDSAVVENIEVQKQLTDDYKSHNELKASGSYVYNHRVNLWGLKEKLFQGFSALTMSTCLDYEMSYPKSYYITEVRVKIHTENGDYIVSCPSQSILANTKVTQHYLAERPLFYPDARAVEMYVLFKQDNDTNTYYIKSDMEECVGLNGAMTVNAITLATGTNIVTDTVCPVSTDLWLNMPSKVYTSAMDNPYHFPLAGINTVGTGTIIGLASTTRALSQGQFGQYPLMAFTTDGIWAMEISASGTYSSIHPISREVATSADGICQLDQAVIFVSARGANLLQESQVTPLSEKLVGVAPGMLNPSVPTSLYPEMVTAITTYFGSGADAVALKGLVSVTESPIKFLQHAYALNDSNNNRVIFIDNNNTGIALVLSLEAFSWSYMAVPKNMVAVPGYPYAYISFPVGSSATTVSDTSTVAASGVSTEDRTEQDSVLALTVNKLYCLDTQYNYLSTERFMGMLLTRALKFGGLGQAIAGYRQSHSIIETSNENIRPHLFFYGSNNLRSWHFIGHSIANRQTYMPAKTFNYFRVGLLLSMRPAEQYMQITLDITDKYNRL